MENILDRISKIADNKGISIGRFESSIGASKGVLSRAIANKTDIQAKWIVAIGDNYPEISPEWLLTGKGNMLKQESLVPAVKYSADPHEGIPLIPIEVVAGWNGVDTQGVSVVDCDKYHIPDFMAAGAEYLIRVSGSSMYPKYSSGDILACKKIHEITFFQWGKIYVIDSAQGAMVKRLFECTTNTDNIICKSDNEKYPPFELPKSEIRSLSIVIGVVRLE